MARLIFPLFLSALALAVFSFCQTKLWRDGEWIYQKNCASCHGDQGQGLGELIPPLAGADFLAKNRHRLPCIVRQGLQDSILVNGKKYEQPMAGVAHLSDIEITNLLNYVNHAWGNDNGVYQLEEVRALLKQCEKPGSPETTR